MEEKISLPYSVISINTGIMINLMEVEVIFLFSCIMNVMKVLQKVNENGVASNKQPHF